MKSSTCWMSKPQWPSTKRKMASFDFRSRSVVCFDVLAHETSLNALNLFQECEDVLKLLGIKALNSAQTALLPDIFAGRDLLAMSPTGSGKSVLYQLPALKENDDASVARRSACLLTVVFSPLVALIEDQTSKAK